MGDQWMQLACLPGWLPRSWAPRALVRMSFMAYTDSAGLGPSPCSTANLLPRGSHRKSTTLSFLLGSSSTCDLMPACR